MAEAVQCAVALEEFAFSNADKSNADQVLALGNIKRRL
jgi:hypothetical protein